MHQTKEVIVVQQEYVEAGIKKYDGTIDEHLESLFALSDLNATPYRFNDGRILLCYAEPNFALLYLNKEVLLERITL